MGAGIAEVFAKAGHPVIGIEYNDEALTRGQQILNRSLDRAVAKGKLSEEDAAATRDRFHFTTDMAEVSGAAFIIEAVNENPELKASIFRALDEHAPADAVLATNTSSLSITAIAAVTDRPEKVVGVHFFNPAPVQSLVEVIRTVRTDDASVDRVLELLRGVGKNPIRCADRAGFVVNALLVAYLNRAVVLYQNGFATREEIDAAMVDRAGYPMGPLTLLDMIGLDVAHAVLVRMYEETRDRLHAPAALLTQLVEAGMFGRKSGQGFYTYADGQVTDAPGPVPAVRESRADELPMALVAGYLNDALRMVEQNYASTADIDTGMSQGCRMPRTFDVVDELGPQTVLAAQQALFAESAEPGHRPSRLLEQLAGAPDPSAALAALRAQS